MIEILTKIEEYAVAARKLTEVEFKQLIQQVVDESRIWFDDPRSWVTYSGFLGFHIHRAVFQYQLGQYDESREINDFVTGCYNEALNRGYPV
jgi:hypothetical protein